ncbi:MAG TPA: SAM-dependent methyltransferase [Candidatus Saccharimonadales bacterium]|nr:SAM-dependent methyltransferase [Candidatus Saccharimonadales bacterium]
MKNNPSRASQETNYVSRGGLKLASVATKFELKLKGKTVLDVGSSTGGFSDFCLQNGAKKIIAIDLGSDQMDAKLRLDPRIELHEKTDIREITKLSSIVDICFVDVSFIRVEQVLPHISRLVGPSSPMVVLFKPQFEASPSQKNKGVIKNESVRRDLTKQFEKWLVDHGLMLINKADSELSGRFGNTERFYLINMPEQKR